jgi:DNA-binding LytR/AlgR family response regulator
MRTWVRNDKYLIQQYSTVQFVGREKNKKIYNQWICKNRRETIIYELLSDFQNKRQKIRGRYETKTYHVKVRDILRFNISGNKEGGGG